LTIIAIKPLPSSLGAAVRLRRDLALDGQDAWLIADLDEDDLELRRSALRQTPRRQRPRKHAQLARSMMPGHPLAVRYLLGRALPRVDLVTVSTDALGGALAPGHPFVFRLPHAREPQPYAPPSPGSRLRIGFFGTSHRYKGTAVLAGVLAARCDVELHLLGDRPPADLETAVIEDPARLVMHVQRGRGTLPSVYATTDVVLLPQDIGSPQTRMQLPAKLVDAMVFGRPVLATPSPPIVEIGGDAIVTVSTWDPLDEALDHLARLGDPQERERLGRRAHARAMAQLTTPVLAVGLQGALLKAGIPA
jgi:hypothetical protein